MSRERSRRHKNGRAKAASIVAEARYTGSVWPPHRLTRKPSDYPGKGYAK